MVFYYLIKINKIAIEGSLESNIYSNNPILRYMDKDLGAAYY